MTKEVIQKNKVSLVIQSNSFRVDEFNKSISVYPDYFQSPILKESGETIPGLWLINSSISEESGPEFHIKSILEKIYPDRSIFLDTIHGREAYMYCIIELKNEMNINLNIEPNSLLELGKLGIKLSIKIYKSEEK